MFPCCCSPGCGPALLSQQFLYFGVGVGCCLGTGSCVGPPALGILLTMCHPGRPISSASIGVTLPKPSAWWWALTTGTVGASGPLTLYARGAYKSEDSGRRPGSRLWMGFSPLFPFGPCDLQTENGSGWNGGMGETIRKISLLGANSTLH